MSGRLRIAFPYLLFSLMALLVVWSNVRSPATRQAGASLVPEMASRDPRACPIHRLSVPQGAGVSTILEGATQRFCNEGCKTEYLERIAAVRAAGGGSAAIDPVCKMEVNAAWGIARVYEDQTFHFCTEKCRLIFATDPGSYAGERCPVCDTPVLAAAALPATYLGRTYLFCSSEHRAAFKEDPAQYFMHRMWGIPSWLYYTSIALVLMVSFFVFERTPARNSGGVADALSEDQLLAEGEPPGQAHPERFDLMRWAVVNNALRSRPFRFAAQCVMVGTFVLIIFAGLFGHQNPALNVAPLLTWTIWWCGLVVLILFASKAWCYICPWDAIATWMERLRLWKKAESGLGLGLPWPKAIRNIWVATLLFVGLTWIELGFGVTMRPRATAYLGIGMLALAIVSAFLFERKSFCRYGCLVGRVSGLYAMFSGLEVRHRTATVCRACRGKECVRGSDTAYGCPTFENPSKMTVNTYCIQCSECLQSCSHDNLAVNLRPWGADLAVEGQPSSDEAYLALLMLAITGFHGLTMTPAWPSLVGWLDASVGLGRIGAFSAGMVGLMGFPLAVYAALVWLSHTIANRMAPRLADRVSYRDYFVRYAYCVLPIALFYHLAHNLEHLLMEGPKVVRLFSDPLGRGWNLLGSAGWSVPPLVSLDILWVLQVILVGVGHIYSLWAAQKISRRTFPDRVAANRGQLPILAGMIAFSILSLWLLKQPMEMRTSAM